MTTFTDGVSPSVTPEPEDGPGRRGEGAEHCESEEQEQEQGGARNGEQGTDTGSAWLREEIQRRIASGRSGSGGRHARREAVDSAGSMGYVPRHSVATPGPGAPAPGPVGGSPQSPLQSQPSELLRRERDAVGGPSRPVAWSRPPRPAEHGPAPDVPADGQRPPAGPPSTPAIRRPAPRPDPARSDGAAPTAAPGASPTEATAPAPAVRPSPGPAPVSTPPAEAPPAVPPATGTTPPPGPVHRPSAAPARTGPPQAARPPRSAGPLSGDPLFTAATPSSSGRPHEPLVTTSPPGTVDVPEQRAPADPVAAPGQEGADADPRNQRVRVVLAERKGVARPVRTVVDIQEGTGVGELLRSNLIGSQLAVALRFAVGAGLTLGLLPVMFAMFPEIGRVEVLGIRLPWLLLGVLVYPFLFGLGLWHTRTAERVEQSFADHVQD
ncbi:hypothetical protein [Pseudonocardia nigra]|uniref:hypothetical protein n=1 Tax=Pseudonocardia nigra TaxID=1921578 RepID=UPI001C5E5687|nr:hypothetical protein [Pseudonocardia nigra]